ncbi:DUF1330 domain-containing protein [Methylibium petroleiphilum]|uniref:DUF1330 domain-containing protein n=1 Tax=Methylibium petroleiphilum TaxID=105560 RepID=UPI003D283BA2
MSATPPAGPAAPAAYVIGHIVIKDPDTWVAYRNQVPATLVPWQGEILVRGRRAVELAGHSPFTDTVVIRFPDTAAVEGWYRSPAYQALIPLRERAAEVVLVGYAM